MIMQELMHHSTIRVTLNTYTNAVTTEKRIAKAYCPRGCRRAFVPTKNTE